MKAQLTRRTLLTTGVGSLLATHPLPALTQASPLRLAFIPQENPDKLLGDIEAISGWLSQELGVPVEGFVTIDHAAAVEALRNGDADISFMGALPFVLAEAEIGAVPLLSEVYRGKPYYTGRIFVRRDSGITSLADLEGRDIAFADPISESGYLYPLAEFKRAGLIAGIDEAEAFFGRIFFAGGYQSFRGFDFRGVSPVDQGVGIGGRWMLLGSVEYKFPVTADEMISAVVFTDMGTVEEEVEMEDFRLTVGAGIRVTIPAMGPVPIALDWGIPVIKQDFDDRRLFSFYIGINR